MSLRSEIFEQPEVLHRLLHGGREAAEQAAAGIRKAGIRSIFVAARGSSDHAALYGKYLWGALNSLRVALATPSLFTLYERPPNLDGCLVVGISQSGTSPDIVGVVEEGRRQGVPTLAVTNDPESALARAADWVFETLAGPELAVAATKTYASQLLSIAMIAAALAGDEERWKVLESLPGRVEEALELDAQTERVAERYRYMSQCVVLGRGFNYATAYEWSLKLKELTYAVAEPYSSADFQHGPVAIVSDGFPVFAIMPEGRPVESMMPLLRVLGDKHRAEILAISNVDEVLELAHTPLALAKDLPEWISPIVSIVPAQLFCYHLTRAKGYDTEAPRGLAKITRTL